MDFIVKRIWWIAIPTALAVLIFQLYWLRNAYLSQQASFRQVATDALQQAYDKAVIAGVKSLDGKKASANFNENALHDTSRIKKRIVGKTITPKILGGASMIAENIIPDSLPATVKLFAATDHKGSKVADTSYEMNFGMNEMGTDKDRFMASILSFSNIVKPDTAVLRKNYTKELLQRHIDLPFTLSVQNKGKMVPGAVSIVSNTIVGSSLIVTAHFANLSKLLLFKILWPIVLSFLLVMLIIGCIWVLWSIIIRQKKLEAMKNDFISNITHELKTPVAILSATNEALLTFEGIKDAEKTERYLRLEQNELHKLQGLVDNILALTRLEHRDDNGESEENVSIPDLLKAVSARFISLPGVHLHTDIQLSQEYLLTQPEALKTILSNLLDNAIKYTPAADKEVQIKVREDSQHYRFIIKDNGIGISKEHLPYIFDKFYRVSQGNIHDVKGYGLGLSHVKSLLQKVGGTISVDSTLGQGAIFTIELIKK
ncbi:MAG TPA: HAMP domain-containing sensor histidine kinase [Chitinophaga sp.]|uniref:sensor histidine kinase n=1 Tax=Chitinophaga sp. TaxID=1869181 RepID=UPI002C2372CC|nr:HAMP domain-containing sensor histidine kinase [Chitinophaga sp.]HVI46418.1 HAMP domain-containing sensor histidine kinase [Chitinophaga sp.]